MGQKKHNHQSNHASPSIRGIEQREEAAVQGAPREFAQSGNVQPGAASRG